MRGIEAAKKAPKQPDYRLTFEQAFDSAIAANLVTRRGVVAVAVERVRLEFWRLCADASHEARRVAFARELSLLRREYPQQQDDRTGMRWIWKRP